MSKYTQPASPANLTAVAAGAVKDVSALEQVGVTVTGTFVATLKLMISLDGTEFAQYGADITAPGAIGPLPRCKAVRTDCSAFTSGAAKVRYGGGDVNR